MAYPAAPIPDAAAGARPISFFGRDAVAVGVRLDRFDRLPDLIALLSALSPA